ncbi:MAG: hypothetical protein IJJ83_09085 [Muribaculaceae bacterium]|nr:hypothetical protein [Muribaculaceae bacterium]
MKINYYRYPSAQGEDESWQNCQFTHETDFSPLSDNKPLVTIKASPLFVSTMLPTSLARIPAAPTISPST